MKRDRDERLEEIWRFILRAGMAVGYAVCLLCLYVCFSLYFDAENSMFGKKTTEETQVLGESTTGEKAQRQKELKTTVQEKAKKDAQKTKEEQERREYRLYQEYCRRLEGISEISQIEENGFSVVNEHVFSMETEGFGTVSLIPALDGQYHRLALFLADEEGMIVYRTEDLETNRRRPGKAAQLTQGIAAVSFQDVNMDGLTDILLITFCSNALMETKTPDHAEDESGAADRHYKLGDVLFQDKEGFYRDVQVSDKLNRFSMNKSAQLIASFVRDGYSAEFLYTALTFTQLREHGFQMVTDQSKWWNFEKLGRLHLVCGTYQMAEYTIFMVYLVNAQGRIIWSLQPMGDYEHLYTLHGVNCCDIDGDGLSDIVILASYSFEHTSGEMVTQKDYSIYYQRTDGFVADTQVKDAYPCTEETEMDDLLTCAWAFWGWGTSADME